jgi:thiol-disulfide isomerase/thioredoxin
LGKRNPTGEPADDFIIETIRCGTEETVRTSLKSLLNGRPALLVFCNYCRDVIPTLQKVLKSPKENIGLIAIKIEHDSFSEMRTCIDSGEQLELLVIYNSNTIKNYPVREWPTVYSVDGSGIIRHRMEGMLPNTEEVIQGWLNDLDQSILE